MELQDLKSLSRDTSISPFTLRKFVRKGLPHYRLGRKILIDPKEKGHWPYSQRKIQAPFAGSALA